MYKRPLLDLISMALGAMVILTLLWAFLGVSPAPPSVIDEMRGSVRYVVDGDSLYIDGHDPQIRL